jgi:hypothetical protein
MAQEQTDVAGIAALQAVKTADAKDPKEMELEQLVFLLLTERLTQLQDKSTEEFKELKKRQDEVVEMHKLLKAINSGTNENSELSFSVLDDLFKQLNHAKNKLGIDIPQGKIAGTNMVYSKDQRERLIDNIRMTIEDHNTKNDMQMQTVTRLINERYESYQMARAILKPIHDDKMSKARAIAGR